MIFTGFAWQLPRSIQERRRVKESFWWRTKGTIIYRKWVSPNQEGRGCKWHVNKTPGFLYGLLTSTKPGTCVPSLQAESKKTQSVKCQLFLQRLDLSVWNWKQIRRVFERTCARAFCAHVCSSSLTVMVSVMHLHVQEIKILGFF